MKNSLPLLLIAFFAPFCLIAQSIFFLTPCQDQTFCLNQGSCTQGNVTVSVLADGGCSTLDYTHRIDYDSNGGTDFIGTGNSFSGNLPKGVHRITWRVNDGCATVVQCTSTITVKDCLPPNLICINGLTQALDAPVCEETFTANQFILNLSDNCTATDQIQKGIRKSGAGTGFPTATNVSYDECDLGTNTLEVWAKDGNGLTSTSFVYVLIQYANSGCDCNPDADLYLKGCSRSPDNQKVPTLSLRTKVESTSGVTTPINKTKSKNTVDSCYEEHIDKLPFGGTYKVRVEASRTGDPLNGVSTFDLLQISKHILGVTPFSSVYQLVAADANDSKTITSFDIVELRKLILGIYDTIPNSQSWRCIKPLANPSNLDTWNTVQSFYQYTLPALNTDTTINGHNFVVVKTGDVNFNASFGPAGDDRSPHPAPLVLPIENRRWQAGESATLAFRLPEAAWLEGFQLALQLDPNLAEWLDCSPENCLENTPGTGDFNFSKAENGSLRLVWLAPQGQRFERDEPIFALKIKALRDMALAEALTLADDWFAPEFYQSGENQARPAVFGFFENEKSAQGPRFFVPQPNPFGEKTSLGFWLPEAAPAHLSVFDLTGKLILEKSQAAERGFGQFEIRADELPSTSFFVFRVQAGEALFSGRLVFKK